MYENNLFRVTVFWDRPGFTQIKDIFVNSETPERAKELICEYLAIPYEKTFPPQNVLGVELIRESTVDDMTAYLSEVKVYEFIGIFSPYK